MNLLIITSYQKLYGKNMIQSSIYFETKCKNVAVFNQLNNLINDIWQIPKIPLVNGYIMWTRPSLSTPEHTRVD